MFPSISGSNYAELLAIVREALSDCPSFYVLGSSFAGPLALMLAEAEPEKVKGVILATTFVSPPRKLFERLKVYRRDAGYLDVARLSSYPDVASTKSD